jgi:hypothetical protein
MMILRADGTNGITYIGELVSQDGLLCKTKGYIEHQTKYLQACDSYVRAVRGESNFRKELFRDSELMVNLNNAVTWKFYDSIEDIIQKENVKNLRAP